MPALKNNMDEGYYAPCSDPVLLLKGFRGSCLESERSDSQDGQIGEEENRPGQVADIVNWRFVNVVPIWGKKKGPNANSEVLCHLASSNKAT